MGFRRDSTTCEAANLSMRHAEPPTLALIQFSCIKTFELFLPPPYLMNLANAFCSFYFFSVTYSFGFAFIS